MNGVYGERRKGRNEEQCSRRRVARCPKTINISSDGYFALLCKEGEGDQGEGELNGCFLSICVLARGWGRFVCKKKMERKGSWQDGVRSRAAELQGVVVILLLAERTHETDVFGFLGAGVRDELGSSTEKSQKFEPRAMMVEAAYGGGNSDGREIRDISGKKLTGEERDLLVMRWDGWFSSSQGREGGLHSADARTPSRHTHRLETGHREVDVKDLEDGEIEEIPAPAQATAAPAPALALAPAPALTTDVPAPAPAPEVGTPVPSQAPPLDPNPAAAPEEEAMQLDDVGVPAADLPVAAAAPASPRFVFGQPAGTGQVDQRDPGAAGPDHAFAFANQAQADQHAAAQMGDMEDIQDDAAAHFHAAVQAPVAAHPPAAATAGQLNAEAAEIAAIIAAILAAAALHPLDDEEIARIARMAPTNSGENPHREPVGPEDLGTAAQFQPNVGEWRKIIASLGGLTADATPKSTKKIMEHFGTHLLLVLSNGGRLYFSRIHDTDEVFQEVFDNFLKDPGAVYVYHLPTEEKPRSEGVTNYGGTISLAPWNPLYNGTVLANWVCSLHLRIWGIFVAVSGPPVLARPIARAAVTWIIITALTTRIWLLLAPLLAPLPHLRWMSSMHLPSIVRAVSPAPYTACLPEAGGPISPFFWLPAGNWGPNRARKACPGNWGANSAGTLCQGRVFAAGGAFPSIFRGFSGFPRGIDARIALGCLGKLAGDC
ncbi:hypothetical protein FB451DRAFT_1182432 [Mycena latifolia]|nr:hypothetical protein FB451DRAFT_1182432 [Mycena latifolia]